jgi:cytidine deaminase
MQLTSKEIEQLIDTAKKARENAFAYRSAHKIGAAILSTDGEYFGGCNTESNISSLGVCAEMSAVDHAVVHGKYEFKALAVIDSKVTYPCGACLQYLTLFSQINKKDIQIIVADLSGNYKIERLDDLLPHEYISEDNSEIKKYKNKTNAY